jgi:ASC-1-like (ASCH) protein
MKHELKILPQFFKAVKNRSKTFEIRVDDRPYEVGDTIHFNEWTGTKYTGDEAEAKINYLLRDTNYVKEGMVVMAIELIESEVK